jgi:lactate dehydrogenase-like 2-hydroxyacid dehydrogenase
VSVEPILESNPLLKVKNKEQLLLTPHIGWGSIEARTKLISLVASNIKEFISLEKSL